MAVISFQTNKKLRSNASYYQRGKNGLPTFFCITLRVFSFSIARPLQLCMGNFTNETQLSYTVCGLPMPTVTLGSTEKITDGLISDTTINDTYYAHKYCLFVSPDRCEVLFFKVVGYKKQNNFMKERHEEL